MLLILQRLSIELVDFTVGRFSSLDVTLLILLDSPTKHSDDGFFNVARDLLSNSWGLLGTAQSCNLISGFDVDF